MKKETIVYIGLGILLIILIKSINFDVEIPNPFSSGDDGDLPDDILNEIEEEISAGPQRQVSSADIALIAGNLQTAMSGLGTNESAVYSNLNRLKNRSDWLALVAQFGIRGGETLTQWLVDDLSEGEMQIVSNILFKINVTI